MSSELSVTSVDKVSLKSPGRNIGTGSAAIGTGRPIVKGAILGFREVSLLQIIAHTGFTPAVEHSSGNNVKSIEAIRRVANRPILVFPECTTSNGRGLLRFADIFGSTKVPICGYRVFLMCARLVGCDRGTVKVLKLTVIHHLH